MGDTFLCWTLGLQSGWGVKRHLRRLRVAERNYVRIFLFKELAKRDLAVESHNVSCFCHSIQSIRTMSKLGSCHLGLKACLPCENDNSWGVVTAASFWSFVEGPLEGGKREGWEGSFPSVGKKGFYLNVLNSLFTTSDPQPRKTHKTQNLLRLLPKGC